MPDLQPFAGLRYNPARVSDWGSVLAPPYDVIDDAQRRNLIARSPYQITRVETAGTDAEIAEASTLLRNWRDDGVLEREPRPAYYLLEQRFDHGGRERTRHCLFLRARLVPWAAGEILPHEWTMAGPKKIRTALRRATQMDISPLFALAQDSDRGLGALLDEAGQLEPVASGSDHSGDHQVLRVVDQPDAVEALRAALAREPIYIADGHHRYESALADRDRATAKSSSWSGDEPENFVLMGLVRAADPGLIVGPTHRLLHVDPPLNAVAAARERFDVRDVGPVSDGPTRLLHAMAEITDAGSGALAIGAVGLEPNRCHLLVTTDTTRAHLAHSLPTAWRKLDISVLQTALLQPLFGVDDDALRDGQAVTYTHKAKAVFAAVSSREAHCGFLLNPPPLDQIFATARSGDRMPQKSTYFKPKLPTGTVLYAFD